MSASSCSALSSYVLAGMNRDNAKATEAGLKYFVLGALSSGMLLYGASLVYGFTGQIQLDQIAQSISMGSRSLGLVFGVVFLLAGIAFKISAVPFHMWTPDVYEGAPTPVTAFFATAPEGRRHGDADPGGDRQLCAGRARLAADRHLPLHRLDGAGLVRRHRTEQPQAPDRLFLDRPYGLRPGRPLRRHRQRRRRRHGLHGHLHGHDGRLLRQPPGAAQRERSGRDHLGPRRTRADAAVRCGDPRGHHVFADRPAAARRLLRQMAGVPGRDRGAPVRPGRDRHAGERGVAPSITCASSRRCISTSRS